MAKSLEQMIPNNIDAEKAVLGSIIIDPDAYDQIAGSLTPEDFYLNAHRIIFEAVVNLGKRRITPDFITLVDELERTEKLNDVDREGFSGAAYITSLINGVPTSGNIDYYAGIVATTAQSRRLIQAATMIVQMGYQNDPQALEKSEQILFNLHRSTARDRFINMPTLMSEYMEELDYLHEHRGAIAGVTTGYHDLDLCLGGFQRSDLILLGARPSMGKTSLALSMGYNAALRGKKVAVFSLEMGRRLLARRLMAMHSKIDMQRLRNGWIEDNEWDKVINAYERLSDLPIWINDTSGSPVASMRSELRRLAREHEGIDEVIVDYVGLIEPDENADKRANLVQQISTISKGLKSLAREFDVPVIALCQLSRAVEGRNSKVPLLSDLRDSGSLEQDADVVLFIHREDYYHLDDPDYTPNNQANIVIAKHRNGPVGVITLRWQPDQTMFYPLSKEEEEEEEA